MKKLLTYILVTGTVSGVASLLFYLNLHGLALKMDTYHNRTYRYIMNGTDANDVLFVGSSRVLVHIDPERVDSVAGSRSYNLSNDGTSLVEHRAMIARYLQSHPAPRCIFLNLDYMCFNVYHETYNFPEYFPLLSDTVLNKYLSPYNAKYRSRTLQRLYTFKWLTAFSDEEKLLSLFNPRELTKETKQRYKGYIPARKTWDEKEAEKNLKRPRKVSFPDEGIKVFTDIVEICRQKGIRLVALIAPSYKDYKKVVTNADDIMKRIYKLCNKHGIEIWDFSKMKLCNSKKYFYNITHLNVAGSRIYTDSIAVRLRSTLMQGEP